MGFWYVIRQAIHKPITEKEIEHALSEVDSEATFEVIPMEVVPPNDGRREAFKDADWAQLQADQLKLFERKFKPLLSAEKQPEFAYFGFAPIPLSLHLGHLVSELYPVTTFQHRHDSKDWIWPVSERMKSLPDIIEPDFSILRSDRDGPVNFRISTAYKVHAEALPRLSVPAIGDVFLGAERPDPDWFFQEVQLDWFMKKVKHSLKEIVAHYPNLTQINLFAAIPSGLAFAIGQEITPTAFPLIQTYQYYGNKAEKYQPAILLNQ